MSLIIMHIIDKNTVLHDNSNKYQHTGEVVISYKGIKLSIYGANTETQCDNIKFAQLMYYHNASASSKQKTSVSFEIVKTVLELHFVFVFPFSFSIFSPLFTPRQASFGCNGTTRAC